MESIQNALIVKTIDHFTFSTYNKNMMGKRLTKKLPYFCLVFYYLCFVIWIQFPAVHSVLDDLYQGRVSTYAILDGFHNHPSDVPFDVFDHHSVTLVYVDKCLICTTCTFNYPVTQLNTNLSIDPSPNGHRLFSDFFCRKPVATIYHTRAPPADLF